MSPPFSAYCTFMSPPTSSARASFCVCSLRLAIVSGVSERGGSEQALSPE